MLEGPEAPRACLLQLAVQGAVGCVTSGVRARLGAFLKEMHETDIVPAWEGFQLLGDRPSWFLGAGSHLCPPLGAPGA